MTELLLSAAYGIAAAVAAYRITHPEPHRRRHATTSGRINHHGALQRTGRHRTPRTTTS